MEAGCARKTSHLETGALSHAMPNKSLEKGGELEIDSSTMTSNLIHQAYVTEPQHKL